jgi:hypothetical protein
MVSENIESKQKSSSPLDAAKKFLMMLAVVTPAVIGTPQSVSAEDAKREPLVELMNEVKDTFGGMAEAFGKLQQFNAGRLEEAKKLGPEVEQAFVGYQQIGELQASTKMELRNLKANLAQAKSLEASTDSLKGDLTQIFIEKNGMVPAAFIRQAPAIIKGLETAIESQEVLSKAAADRYFSLLDQAEKAKK